MLSYYNDAAVKSKYLERVQAHYLADEIVQGKYWEDGKGCAVGCTIHGSEHKKYETELGLPTWLALLEDKIFEGLPNQAAKEFPRQFLDAIPVGVNLEPVKWKFCAFLLKENIERVLKLSINDELKKQVVDAIRGCLALHESAVKSGVWNESAARSAESAAWSAARSAASAAWSAASAAWSAASAAWSAASAAWSAARSAASAESAAYELYRDELLRLLRQAE